MAILELGETIHLFQTWSPVSPRYVDPRPITPSVEHVRDHRKSGEAPQSFNQAFAKSCPMFWILEDRTSRYTTFK